MNTNGCEPCGASKGERCICSQIDRKVNIEPKPKKVETVLAVNSENKITGFAYRGIRYEKGERFVNVREVHTDAELREIAESVVCVGKSNPSYDSDLKSTIAILKKHFGRPSE